MRTSDRGRVALFRQALRPDPIEWEWPTAERYGEWVPLPRTLARLRVRMREDQPFRDYARAYMQEWVT